MAGKGFDLSGKVALVTGGNGGIGLGMAEGLAQAGCGLVIWGGNPDKNAAAEKKLKAYGHRVLVQKVNVADEAQVEAGFTEALKQMGRIDGCFANAGVSQKRAAFHELSTEEWRRVLSVNLDGAFFCLRAAARHMVERSKNGDTAGGRLVGMASTASVHGAARAQSYAASKGAVKMLTKGMAIDLGKHGIQVNGLGPGYFKTELNRKLIDDPAFSGWLVGRTPSRRWGEVEELAGAAVFLASEAGRFVNGHILYVDGGLTASV